MWIKTPRCTYCVCALLVLLFVCKHVLHALLCTFTAVTISWCATNLRNLIPCFFLLTPETMVGLYLTVASHKFAHIHWMRVAYIAHCCWSPCFPQPATGAKIAAGLTCHIRKFSRHAQTQTRRLAKAKAGGTGRWRCRSVTNPRENRMWIYPFSLFFTVSCLRARICRTHTKTHTHTHTHADIHMPFASNSSALYT